MNVRVSTPSEESVNSIDLRYAEDSETVKSLNIEPYKSSYKIDFYINGFSGYYWCYISNYQYSQEVIINFPQGDIYLYISNLSKPINITVTTTIKYLNFDS